MIKSKTHVRFTAILTAALLVLSLSLPVAALEEPLASTPASPDAVDGLYNGPAAARASGLINDKWIRLSKDGGKLIITGYTKGIEGVNKTGFTYVTLQYLENGKWKDYTTWTDLYSQTNRYNLYTTLGGMPSGNFYRLICNHHAEKPGFLWGVDKEDIYNETPALKL